MGRLKARGDRRKRGGRKAREKAGRGGRDASRDRGGRDGAGVQTIRLWITDNDCGKVLGKRGDMLKQIEADLWVLWNK